MLQRFGGTVERFAALDIAGLAAWVTGISLYDWPQQRQRELRPAMVSDPAWHDYGLTTEPIVRRLMMHFPGAVADTRLLSAVMPGHSIEPHTDGQPPNWLCRVHVPILSNDESRFIVGGEAHHLTPGAAYRVNTEAVHSVENAGSSPRIHFMFDVKHGNR